MAEEPLEDKEGIPNKRKKSKKSKKSKAHQSDLRKLSQPAEETVSVFWVYMPCHKILEWFKMYNFYRQTQ